jgi:phospholipid/cholesterol/gamma-HCH transport system substrate-binding protein
VERRANHLAVGSFILGFLVLSIFVILWLHRYDINPSAPLYDIYFQGSVGGLRNNEKVLFQGVPIGHVRHVEINPDEPEYIRVSVAIRVPKLIREDTVASLETQGFTGLAYIQLDGSNRDSPLLIAKEGQRYPVIRSIPSRLQKVVNAAPKILDKLTTLSDQLILLFSTSNRKKFENILTHLEDVSGTMAKHISPLIKETRTSLGTLTDTLQTIRQESTTMSQSFKESLASLKKASDSFSTTASQLDSLLTNNKADIQKLLGSGAQDLSHTLSQGKQLVRRLNQIMLHLDRSPVGGLLTSTANKGRKIPWHSDTSPS